MKYVKLGGKILQGAVTIAFLFREICYSLTPPRPQLHPERIGMRLPILLRTLFCPTHSRPHLPYILLRIWQPVQGLVITCGLSGILRNSGAVCVTNPAPETFGFHGESTVSSEATHSGGYQHC